MAVEIPVEVNTLQNNWRFCRRCFGMFFDGDPHHNGFCPHPDGGSHQGLGWDFNLLADPANPVDDPPDLPS